MHRREERTHAGSVRRTGPNTQGGLVLDVDEAVSGCLEAESKFEEAELLCKGGIIGRELPGLETMAVERAKPVLAVAAGRDAEPGVHVDALRRQSEDPHEKSGQHVPAVIDAETAVRLGRVARGVNRLDGAATRRHAAPVSRS